MPPFRWTSTFYDIILCKEVAEKNPTSPAEWEKIAETLRREFSTSDKVVEIKGRGCRERLDRLLQKYRQDDKRSLKKSGTEEEYTELQQLLHDISTYRRDMEELKNKEKMKRKHKEKQDREKGLEMREAALSGMAKRKYESDDDATSSSENDGDDGSSATESKTVSKEKKNKKRATRVSAVQMLEAKYQKKADLKEQELKLRMAEFELQKKKYDDEASERKERLKFEQEERRVFLSLLKDKL